MPRLTPRLVVTLAALAAALAYGNAPRNGWARDDLALVVNNPAAHSVRDAWHARFQPYWPPDEQVGSAGLYRPVVTLSFATTWSVVGDAPGWFHVENVALHVVATVLLTLVALAWLSPAGALVAGLVFAVHPVHVEAVANVVGRADVMAGLCMLGAVLAARRYRASDSWRVRATWASGVVVLTALGLGSKEYAVATVAIVLVDEYLTRPHPRRMYPLYVALVSLTVAWFSVWASVAGDPVEVTVAGALRGLDTGERLATAVPVLLHVVRLLVWPLDLASSYDPQVVPQRLAWTWVATGAAALAAALIALALVLSRRAPAVTFGLLVAAATLAPTSNLFFASGLVLAERTLYLAVAAPALAAGVLATAAFASRHRRGILWLLAAWLAVLAVRTWTGTPFWRDTRAVVTREYLQIPENYRTHVATGRVWQQLGDSTGALREYLWADELFDRDPFIAVELVPLALELGRTALALRQAHHAWSLMPANAPMARMVAETLRRAGLPDSARAVARVAISRNPTSLTAAQVYRAALADPPAWQRELAEARVAWLEGRLGAATTRLAAARDALSDEKTLGSQWCWEIETLIPTIRALDPPFEALALDVTARTGGSCSAW